MDTTELSFEQAMKELEELVTQMEQGDISLEKSLTQFERGIHLAKHSQALLTKAEQRVKILTEQDSDEKLVDFVQPDQE